MSDYIYSDEDNYNVINTFLVLFLFAFIGNECICSLRQKKIKVNKECSWNIARKSNVGIAGC